MVQRGLLNSVAPIVNLHDCCTRAIAANETMEAAGVLDALNHTLALIGDANISATYERRKLVLAAIQPELAEYASKEPGDPNSNNLFGQELRSKIKEAIELNKDLDLFQKCLTPPPKKQKFSSGQSAFYGHGRGTNNNGRGGFNGRGNRGSGGRGNYRGKGSFNKPAKDSQGEVPFPNFIQFPAVHLAGRVSRFADFWKTLTCDQWVQDVLRGYKLPLVIEPDKFIVNVPHGIPKTEFHVMDDEIESMLAKGAIIAVSGEPFLTHQMILVLKRTGGVRPVINLKPLNKFLRVEHFKLEQITMLKDLLEKDMWMSKIDLQDAYYTIPVHEDHQKYLQFVWKDQLYQ